MNNVIKFSVGDLCELTRGLQFKTLRNAEIWCPRGKTFALNLNVSHARDEPSDIPIGTRVKISSITSNLRSTGPLIVEVLDDYVDFPIIEVVDARRLIEVYYDEIVHVSPLKLLAEVGIESDAKVDG